MMLLRLVSGRRPASVTLPAVAPVRDPGPVHPRRADVDGGVPLRRVVQVVRLSRVQAAVLLADLAGRVASIHGAGRVHGALDLDSVRLGPGGRVQLDEGVTAAPPAGAEAELRRADLEGVVTIAAQVLRAARWPRDGDLPQADPFAAVGRLADGNGMAGDAAAVAATLDRLADDPAVDSAARSRARAELAALAGVLARHGRSRAWSAVVRPAASPRRPAFPWNGSPPPVWRLGLRRLSVILLAVVVLGSVVGLEYAFLRGEIAEDVRLLLGRSAARASPAEPAVTARPPAPVPVVAPAAAGLVRAVDLRGLGPCRPGGVCPVRVLVVVRPGAEPVRVEWRLVVVDRCTGRQTGRPGGVVALPPRTAPGYDLGGVRLPRGRSLAVIAVTGRPARAAAPPLLVPADGGSCG